LNDLASAPTFIIPSKFGGSKKTQVNFELNQLLIQLKSDDLKFGRLH
jgi:hypothetical protein